MNKKLQIPFWVWKIMKLSIPQFILLFVCCMTACAIHSNGQNILDKPISIQAENTHFKGILTRIEEQAHVRFMYSSNAIDVQQRINVQVRNKRLEEVLKELLPPLSIEYSISGKRILLRKVATKQKIESDLVAPITHQQQDAANIERTIKGRVKDEKGVGLPGVTVLVKGTLRGSITDSNGGFSIEIPEQNTILVLSFVGYLTQEVAVENQTVLEISLKIDEKALEEVVVVGYGTTKRKDFTGSVGSLNLENSPIAMAPNINVLEALKGSIAGLNIGAVNAAGGEPGMLIRGQNSINGSNTPLIVLDGVIYMGSLSSINPNDIATIDVLKDATSAAAYGSRSANGVIAITTKRGRTGKPVISFNTSLGFQKWQNRPEMLRGDDWIKMVNDRNKYAAGSTNWMRPGEVANREAGHETVWLDEVSRTGIMQNYQTAISGATETINYYLSTSFDDNNSIVVGDKFNRIALLGKLKANVTKWLEVGVDAGFAKRDYFGGAASLSAAQMMSPYGVMYRDDQGNLEKYPYTESAINPLWGVNDGTRNREEVRHDYRLNSHALIKIPGVQGLTYRINYLLNQDKVYYGDFFYENYFVAEGSGLTRYAPTTIQGFLVNANGSIETRTTNSYVLDNIVNYDRLFGKHAFNATLVATRDQLKYEQQTSTGSDFAANGNTALGIRGLHKATVQRLDINGYERANVGYMGRINYAFDHKYFFTGSYRRDGASVFGIDNKWAQFWAAGVAWRITKEPFLQSFQGLDDLKIKFSWGQNGNQGIGPYTTLSTVSNGASGGIRYEFSNTPGRIYYGLSQNSLGNSFLGWETTSSWNAGFESVWLKNRLFVDVDMYVGKTTDQIFTRNIPVMTGFSTMIASMGQVNNKGIETTVRYVGLQKRDWNWSTGVTFWKNINKLVSLYGEDLDNDGREDDDIANNLFIGKSLGAIYGYEQIGIVQPGDTEYIQLTGAAPGAPKYRDLDGKPGITANDRKVLGFEKENFRLNLSNTISYKNLNLYVMITGTFGGNNLFLRSNTQAYMTSGTNRPYDNTHYIPYWTPENQSNEYPSATFAGDGRFLGLQNRTFVRVQDVSLSYAFAQAFLSKAKLGSLKVFTTAKNLATFTKWVGGDPEVGSRMRENGLPVASTYSLGLNLNF